MLALLATSILMLRSSYAFPCCQSHAYETSCISELKGGNKGNEDCQFVTDESMLLKVGMVPCVSRNMYDCEIMGFCPPGYYDPPYGGPTQCDMEVCDDTEISYNILIAVDSTAGVSSDDYEMQINFVENLISRQVQEDANIALVVFNGKDTLIYSFKEVYNQKKNALKLLEKAKKGYSLYSETCMTDLLDSVIEVFKDAPEAEKNYVYIVAGPQEGKCADPCNGGYQSKYTQAFQDAFKQTAAEDTVKIIGIGSTVSDNHLICLVAHTTDLVSVAAYDEETFYRLESAQRPILCVSPPTYRVAANINNVVHNLGVKNGMTMWVLFAAFIMSALAYYYRNTLCNKGKTLTVNNGQETYGSVEQI